MAFGEILRNARTQRGMTTSEVAEQTRILVQLVDDLEREDFQRIAAPLYGRGFIKSYAKLMDLDAQPLINDFMQLYSGARPPVVLAHKEAAKEETDNDAAPKVEPVRTKTQPVNTAPKRSMVPREEAGVAVSAVAVEAHAQASKVAPPVPLRMAPAKSESAPAHTTSGTTENVAVGAKQEPKKDFRPVLVVEPEVTEEAADREPDLFSIPVQKKQQGESTGETRQPVRMATQKRRLAPGGGEYSSGRIPTAQTLSERDGATLEGRQARMRTLAKSLTRLRSDIGGKLPALWHNKRTLLASCAGVVLLVLMTTGIAVLFKMTETGTKAKNPMPSDRVAPPPVLYID